MGAHHRDFEDDVTIPGVSKKELDYVARNEGENSTVTRNGSRRRTAIAPSLRGAEGDEAIQDIRVILDCFARDDGAAYRANQPPSTGRMVPVT
jgi:hypothetical protein